MKDETLCGGASGSILGTADVNVILEFDGTHAPEVKHTQGRSGLIQMRNPFPLDPCSGGPLILPGSPPLLCGVTSGIDPQAAWFRGIGPTNINQYQKVELWASPYSPDPAGLAPFKVDDYGFTGIDTLMGSTGRAAAPVPDGGPPYGTTAVWDLATKTRTLYTLPNNHRVFSYVGLTSKYLWVAAAPDSSTPIDMFVRFALK